MSDRYQLQCRECGRSFGNQPRAICDDCLAPLEVRYDLDSIRKVLTRERIAQRPPQLWRYAELLPLPEDFRPTLPTGFTPLLEAPRLAEELIAKTHPATREQHRIPRSGTGRRRLYLKNDAVCLPTLSFKDRVVAVALAQARNFGFEVVACSSTGNLANAVAAQAARGGFKACIFIPADLEPAKIVGTQVYGTTLVRVAGNYDQVSRLCSQLAERYHWGFVNVNLRPYLSLIHI